MRQKRRQIPRNGMSRGDGGRIIHMGRADRTDEGHRIARGVMDRGHGRLRCFAIDVITLIGVLRHTVLVSGRFGNDRSRMTRMTVPTGHHGGVQQSGRWRH